MKRQIMVLFFCVAGLWQAAGFAAPQVNEVKENMITEISLERSPSDWDQMPADKVVLYADGTAIYIGRRNVDRIGHFKGKIRKETFEKLVKLLTTQDFFDLKEISMALTDTSISVVSVTRGGKGTTFIDHGIGNYPITLWGIEMAIRGVAANIKWKKVEPKSDAEKTKTNLRGVAMAGPISPVEREGEPNEKPLAGAVITIQPDGGGKEIIRKRADKEGRFEFALEPGTYLLVPLGPQASDVAPEEDEPDDKPKKKWMLPSGEPQTIVIEAGKVTEVVVHYDTGIR